MTVKKFPIGGPVLWVDTTNPTANDDRADGVRRGHWWINETNYAVWLCLDETTAAAIWIPVGGGIANAVTALYSLASGGQGNVVNGESSFIGGGYSNIINGIRSAILGGTTNTINGDDCLIAAGKGNVIDEDLCVALGALAHCTMLGQLAFSAGGASGALLQLSLLPLYGDATSTTPVIVGLDLTGVSRLKLPANSSWGFQGRGVARRLDADNENGGFSFEGVIKRDATLGSTALLGTVTVAKDTNTPAAWTLAVSADTTNGALLITFAGEAAKTVRCAVKLDLIQISE